MSAAWVADGMTFDDIFPGDIVGPDTPPVADELVLLVEPSSVLCRLLLGSSVPLRVVAVLSVPPPVSSIGVGPAMSVAGLFVGVTGCKALYILYPPYASVPRARSWPTPGIASSTATVAPVSAAISATVAPAVSAPIVSAAVPAAPAAASSSAAVAAVSAAVLSACC
eukprot:GHVS01103522.1.p1 GENE.GHVS01103522.1~~GHVS01103522.1.p1  ORF type:complete len:167 (-),score=40.49 GHVS01103522.1:119-619(-)